MVEGIKLCYCSSCIVTSKVVGDDAPVLASRPVVVVPTSVGHVVLQVSLTPVSAHNQLSSFVRLDAKSGAGNRAAEVTFVLDFVNEPETVQVAFQPYYERTHVGEEVEPHQLYDLQDKVMGRHVVHEDEVEEFAKVYFAPGRRSDGKLHRKLYALIDPAVGRFEELPEEEQDEYRNVLTAFRNLYSFLSQVIPYHDSDLEKLYTYRA